MKRLTGIILVVLLVGHYSGVAKWWCRPDSQWTCCGVDFARKYAISLVVYPQYKCAAICFYDRMNRRVPFALCCELDAKCPFRIQWPE